MIWIEFCNYLFYALIFTSMTGSIFALIWVVIQKTVMRNDCIAAKRLLRIVIHAYMIPVLFIALLARYKDGYLSPSNWESDNLISYMLFDTSPKIREVITIVMTVWLAALVVTMGYWSRQFWKLRAMLRGSVPEDDKTAILCLEQMKSVLGIKRKIRLLQNDMVSTAFTAGVFRQTIVLPYGTYSEEEYRIMLAHELVHCKERDLFYKFEAVWANILHAWNPLVYYVRKRMALQMEYACDAKVWMSCQSLFGAKEYFAVILKVTQERGKKLNYLIAALTESPSKLQRRVSNMKRFQTKGVLKRGVMALVTGVFLLGGSMTAYAAGNEVVDAQDNWYEDTRVEILSAENTETEYIVLPEDVEDVPTVIISGGISLYTTVNVDWNVPSGSKYRTSAFHLDNGDQVSVAIKTTPSGKNVKVGLIWADGSEHYVNCSGMVSHTFTADRSGSYCFYIYNTSDVTVHAEGAYVR